MSLREEAQAAAGQAGGMSGAESIVHTLIAGGVDVCFANPGTSEMHFVAALDSIAGIRCVLGLFEGVVTGAADGYARMAAKPAVTLLHLGPGLANGLANMHNARRARSPMVNIVGDHASYHRAYDAPLTSDVEAVARPFSDWMVSATRAETVAADAAAALTAARTSPGRVATMILPADVAWSGGGAPVAVASPPARLEVSQAAVAEALRILRSGAPTALMLSGSALGEAELKMAGRIAEATGAELLAQTANGRIERGAGRVAIERVPYPVPRAIERLRHLRHIILVEARKPVAFFGYPGQPSLASHPDCAFHELARSEEDSLGALTWLAEELGVAGKSAPVEPFEPPGLPTGTLTVEKIAALLGALLPEQAIVADESVSSGRGFFPFTQRAQPHSWLQITGGSIGLGLPMASGAAIACPERKVVCLQADGSGMYTLQALWTQAREGLDVTTVVLANRSYAILRGELANLGFRNPGPRALDMLSLENPALDWVCLARGMGVEGRQVSDAEGLAQALSAGLGTPGPYLIEALI